jgi:hypothetical protein
MAKRKPKGTTGIPKYKGTKRAGTDYVPQGPGGKGTASTQTIVRTSKRKRDDANTKGSKKALKGAKAFNARTGKRVAIKDAWNPRTKDWRGGLRIEKGGNAVTTSTNSKES